MKKIDIAAGMYYLEVPEEDLRILCGCPENSIKFIMQKGLTPKIDPENSNFVGGPNAILLNDISILNSHFLNFAEFPVLHHQFFQGAAFNGKDEKFTIIGIESRVKNQQEYIRRGFQGLVTKEELLEADLDDQTADKFLAMGNYHRGKDNKFEILKPVYISGNTHIKGNLYLRRMDLNIFEFIYNDQRVVVDLNLPKRAKGVGLPYTINKSYIKPNEFSVTTVGDGNGWNPEVPCMSSVLEIKGKKYLVDSGPGSLDLLKYLGVSPSELDGIFLTHSHDDHFAGILSMLNAENKMKFFATSLVKTSIQKKFQSLLNVDLDILKKYIDFIELKEGHWIDLGDMEVKANYSFHTVETNVFFFKVIDGKNSKVYGHITDITSKRDLDIMIQRDITGIIARDWTYNWFNHYLERCDLKRIDAGGGPVHGDNHDFIDDKSDKIILSHLDKDIDTSGSEHFMKPTGFGHTEVLIKAKNNYNLEQAREIVSDIGLDLFLDPIQKSDIVIKKPGEVVFAKGEVLTEMYLVLTGMVEGFNDSSYVRKYVKGDFIYTFNREKRSKSDYISNSYSTLVKIDYKSFLRFINKEKHNSAFKFLRNCSFFSYGSSYGALLKLSSIMIKKRVKRGEDIVREDNKLFFLEKGEIQILKGSTPIEVLKRDDLSVYSMNTRICKRDPNISQKALSTSIIYEFNRKDTLRFIALVWSIFEEYKKIETIVEIGRI